MWILLLSSPKYLFHFWSYDAKLLYDQHWPMCMFVLTVIRVDLLVLKSKLIFITTRTLPLKDINRRTRDNPDHRNFICRPEISPGNGPLAHQLAQYATMLYGQESEEPVRGLQAVLQRAGIPGSSGHCSTHEYLFRCWLR